MLSPFNESSNKFFFDLTRSIMWQKLTSKKKVKHTDFFQSLINTQKGEVDDLDELDLAGIVNSLKFDLR